MTISKKISKTMLMTLTMQHFAPIKPKTETSHSFHDDPGGFADDDDDGDDGDDELINGGEMKEGGSN